MEMLIERRITCPYCWQPNDVLLDRSVPEQSLIEDCRVCCQPITLRYVCGPANDVRLEVERAQ